MATCWKFLKKNLDIFEKKIQILYLTKNWTFLSTIVDVFPRSILSENGQAASWREFYESAKHLGKAHLLQGKYHCTADLLFVFSCFAYVEKTTGLLVLCKLKPVKLKASDTSPPRYGVCCFLHLCMNGSCYGWRLSGSFSVGFIFQKSNK